MTRIKYATIAVARKSKKLTIVRGKKTGQIGFRQPDDDGEIFGDPIYSEEIVTLPETMTPDEYNEYVEGLEGTDSALTQAVKRVADEHDLDVEFWFEGDGR